MFAPTTAVVLAAARQCHSAATHVHARQPEHSVRLHAAVHVAGANNRHAHAPRLLSHLRQAQSPRARQRRMHVIRREAHTQCLSSCHSLWEACRGRTRHASMGSLAFSQGPACVCDVGAQSQATAEVTHTECSNAWVTVSHNGALHTLLLFSCAQLQTATPPTTRAHNTHNTRRRCWLCTSSWALCL